jgi:hypothetical protein
MMPDYQQRLSEVEQATARLDWIDALDQEAVRQALDLRAAAIERLSAALAAASHEQLAGDVERRLREVLSKGNCAMMRLSGARQSLAIQLAHTQHVQHTIDAMHANLSPHGSLCRWEG